MQNRAAGRHLRDRRCARVETALGNVQPIIWTGCDGVPDVGPERVIRGTGTRPVSSHVAAARVASAIFVGTLREPNAVVGAGDERKAFNAVNAQQIDVFQIAAGGICFAEESLVAGVLLIPNRIIIAPNDAAAQIIRWSTI